MPPAAEPGERVDRDAPLGLTKGDHGDGQFLHQVLELTGGRLAAPSREHQARFNQRRRTDAHVARVEDPVHEVKVPRLREQYGDEGGGVERHTPPGP